MPGSHLRKGLHRRSCDARRRPSLPATPAPTPTTPGTLRPPPPSLVRAAPPGCQAGHTVTPGAAQGLGAAEDLSARQEVLLRCVCQGGGEGGVNFSPCPSLLLSFFLHFIPLTLLALPSPPRPAACISPPDANIFKRFDLRRGRTLPSWPPPPRGAAGGGGGEGEGEGLSIKQKEAGEGGHLEAVGRGGGGGG